MICSVSVLILFPSVFSLLTREGIVPFLAVRSEAIVFVRRFMNGLVGFFAGGRGVERLRLGDVGGIEHIIFSLGLRGFIEDEFGIGIVVGDSLFASGTTGIGEFFFVFF